MSAGLDGIWSLDLTWNVCWGVGLVDLDLDADLDIHITTHGDRPELFWQRDDQDGFHCPPDSIATVTAELPAKGAIDPDRKR